MRALRPLLLASVVAFAPRHAPAQHASRSAVGFVGWPRDLPRPDGLVDIAYPYGEPHFDDLRAGSCTEHCVIEFGIRGDLSGSWHSWVAALARAGWRIASEHESAGSFWLALQDPARPDDRFQVVVGPVRDGGRGQMRRMSRARRPPRIGTHCQALPAEPASTADAAVITWPFDLDRDGALDAAVYADGVWQLYVVRGRCAVAAGIVAGELVRIADEQIDRDGWLRVEADAYVQGQRTRVEYLQHGGEYAPDETAVTHGTHPASLRRRAPQGVRDGGDA